MWITYSWGETCRDTKRSGWHLGSVSKLIQAITTFLGIDTHSARSHVDISAPSAPVLLIEETCVFSWFKNVLVSKNDFCMLRMFHDMMNMMSQFFAGSSLWTTVLARNWVKGAVFVTRRFTEVAKLHGSCDATDVLDSLPTRDPTLPTAPWCDLGDKPKISNKKTMW